MTFLKKYSNFIESNYPIRSAIPFMKELLNKEELTIKSALKSVSNGTREHCFFNSISVKI